mgnify:CR=1 FL=1
MQRRAAQSIVMLTKEDFHEMLFDLEMILRPVPSYRDEKDAQELLSILFPPEADPVQAGQDASEI